MTNAIRGDPIESRVYSREWDVTQAMLTIIRSHTADIYAAAIEDVCRDTGLTRQQAEVACFEIQDLFKKRIWDESAGEYAMRMWDGSDGEYRMLGVGRIGQLRDRCDVLIQYTQEERRREGIEG